MIIAGKSMVGRGGGEMGSQVGARILSATYIALDLKCHLPDDSR